MPVFPKTVSLIAPPSNVWSNGQIPTATSPVLTADYKLGNLTDGTVRTVTRFAFGTFQITVTLASPQTPNIFAILNHNLDPGLVVGVSNGAGFSRGFSVRDPNAWVDVRDAPASATWTLSINANSIPVTIGQLIVATGILLDGQVSSEPQEEITFPSYRERTEYGKLYLSASGVMARRMAFNLVATETNRAALATINAQVGVNGGCVVVVPVSNRNDVWFTEWANLLELTRLNPLQTGVGLDLVEQSGGVLYGR